MEGYWLRGHTTPLQRGEWRNWVQQVKSLSQHKSVEQFPKYKLSSQGQSFTSSLQTLSLEAVSLVSLKLQPFVPCYEGGGDHPHHGHA